MTNKKKKLKKWFLYDGRYRTNKERATCFEICDSFEEAKKNSSDYGEDTVIVETQIYGIEIKNQKIVN